MHVNLGFVDRMFKSYAVRRLDQWTRVRLWVVNRISVMNVAGRGVDLCGPAGCEQIWYARYAAGGVDL